MRCRSHVPLTPFPSHSNGVQSLAFPGNSGWYAGQGVTPETCTRKNVGASTDPVDGKLHVGQQTHSDPNSNATSWSDVSDTSPSAVSGFEAS